MSAAPRNGFVIIRQAAGLSDAERVLLGYLAPLSRGPLGCCPGNAHLMRELDWSERHLEYTVARLTGAKSARVATGDRLPLVRIKRVPRVIGKRVTWARCFELLWDNIAALRRPGAKPPNVQKNGGGLPAQNAAVSNSEANASEYFKTQNPGPVSREIPRSKAMATTTSKAACQKGDAARRPFPDPLPSDDPELIEFLSLVAPHLAGTSTRLVRIAAFAAHRRGVPVRRMIDQWRAHVAYRLRRGQYVMQPDNFLGEHGGLDRDYSEAQAAAAAPPPKAQHGADYESRLMARAQCVGLSAHTGESMEAFGQRVERAEDAARYRAEADAVRQRTQPPPEPPDDDAALDLAEALAQSLSEGRASRPPPQQSQGPLSDDALRVQELRRRLGLEV